LGQPIRVFSFKASLSFLNPNNSRRFFFFPPPLTFSCGYPPPLPQTHPTPPPIDSISLLVGVAHCLVPLYPGGGAPSVSWFFPPNPPRTSVKSLSPVIFDRSSCDPTTPKSCWLSLLKGDPLCFVFWARKALAETRLRFFYPPFHVFFLTQLILRWAFLLFPQPLGVGGASPDRKAEFVFHSPFILCDSFLFSIVCRISSACCFCCTHLFLFVLRN